ncbi:PREDICTED: translation initiation factor IF-2-like [Chinchilla lanigera]|uniref:translation initiation factor IF-2-like n=1 Tax=Chinchilla lanigera TaxID=34839 RepID=UPI0006963D9C|nr:PREDICTED: translation initiation factor IF-2-like [Chinchilla lanigera]
MKRARVRDRARRAGGPAPSPSGGRRRGYTARRTGRPQLCNAAFPRARGPRCRARRVRGEIKPGARLRSAGRGRSPPAFSQRSTSPGHLPSPTWEAGSGASWLPVASPGLRCALRSTARGHRGARGRARELAGFSRRRPCGRGAPGPGSLRVPGGAAVPRVGGAWPVRVRAARGRGACSAALAGALPALRRAPPGRGVRGRAGFAVRRARGLARPPRGSGEAKRAPARRRPLAGDWPASALSLSSRLSPRVKLLTHRKPSDR